MNVDETRRFQCREEKRVSQPIPQMEFSEEFARLDVPNDPALGKPLEVLVKRREFTDEFKREASQEGANGRPKLSSAGVQSLAARFGVPWMINCEANKEGQ